MSNSTLNYLVSVYIHYYYTYIVQMSTNAINNVPEPAWYDFFNWDISNSLNIRK